MRFKTLEIGARFTIQFDGPEVWTKNSSRWCESTDNGRWKNMGHNPLVVPEIIDER